ncbi:hypothetical protein BF49_4632 [Bradyrhizobium sp.]|nr:hypothetical protein BF49_4632 [Bradyrhizobium sp.]
MEAAGHVLSFDVAGVHDQVIEPRELDQVALTGMEGFEHH